MRRLKGLFVLTLMLALFAGCGGGGGGTVADNSDNNDNDDNAPDTTITYPAIETVKLVKPDGTEADFTNTPLPLGVKIRATFDVPVDESLRSEVENVVSVKDKSDNLIAGTFSWNEDYTQLTFKPKGLLKYRMDYTVSLDVSGLETVGVKAVDTVSDSFRTTVKSDVNGDGFADLAVGAGIKEIDGDSERGAAYIFNGSASGIVTDYATKIQGMDAEDVFGLDPRTADINGDGFADLVVGSCETEDRNGGVFIYYGSSSGIPDANDPLSADVVIGPDGYNLSCAKINDAGDVNGDGYNDLIIGAKYSDMNTGAVLIYYGSDSLEGGNPDAVIYGANGGDYFGYALAGAGDVNGDGYDDVIISSLATGKINYVSLFYGSEAGISNGDATAAVRTFYGSETEDGFGFSLDSAGDVNGDGYDDVIIGAPSWGGGDYIGKAYLFYGSETGLPETPDKTYTGEGVDYGLGYVAEGGDLNGDGFSDVVVGAVTENFDGKSYIYLGSANGLPDVTDKEFASSGGEVYGGVLPSLDLNGDGLYDAIVTAPMADSGKGRAYVHYGSSTDIGGTEDYVSGETANDYLGAFFMD